MNASKIKLLGGLLIVVALALAVTGARLWNRSDQFHATATVKIERDKIDLPELGKGAPAGVDNTFFIQTEIELMQSEAPLTQVIEQLDLNQVWGKKYQAGQTFKTSETLSILKRQLQLSANPGDTHIVITVTSDDAAEAARIANAVAQAYCDYRLAYRHRLAQSALAGLSEKFKELETKITAAQQRVEKAGANLDPSLRHAATATDPTEEEKLQALRNRYSSSVLHYIAQSNQFVIFSATDGHDEQIAGELAQRAEKTKTEMVTTEAAIKDEIRKLDSQRTYQAAQQELDELNQVFAPLKKTVAGLQHDLGPQEHPPAEIVDRAAPPAKANAPEGTPGWVFLAAGGFAFALGVALILLAGKLATSA